MTFEQLFDEFFPNRAVKDVEWFNHVLWNHTPFPASRNIEILRKNLAIFKDQFPDGICDGSCEDFDDIDE